MPGLAAGGHAMTQSRAEKPPGTEDPTGAAAADALLPPAEKVVPPPAEASPSSSSSPDGEAVPAAVWPAEPLASAASAVEVPVGGELAPPAPWAGGWLARLRPPALVPGWVADLVALGVIVAAATTLLAEALLFGQVQRERDTYLFYYPVYQWFAEQLKAGRFPLWMPQLFSGYPLFADGETGMLYPLHWLFFGLLPTPVAFIALRFLHLVMAGAFMYAWMRALALRRLAALLAALTFAYGSFLVGQIHHENLVRTAVWLPLVLCWIELAYRGRGRARACYLLAGGATLGVQLTALHVQPALITLMALSLYVAFRTVCPPAGVDIWPAAWRQRATWLGRRLLLSVAVLAGVIGVGLGLAMAQLLPLYELGQQTFRGERVPFAFATSYSIHPSQLVTLLFPYFFRSPTGSWPLWVGWETVVYVGVAPLVLALVALAAVRRREVIFFALLGTFGALLAFGDYSPIPVLELLWPLPGFSALRVPGRYSLLLVVALAVLAAYGLDWVERSARERPRRRALLAAALGVNAGVLALLALFVLARSWLLQAPEQSKALIASTYLAVRRMYRELSPDTVYTGLLHALDLNNRRTELGFILLLAVGVLLLLCYLAGRRAALWRAGLVALAGVDLVLWGRSFHGRQPLAELLQPPPSVQYLLAQGDSLDRLWVTTDTLRSLEYNRPATWGLNQAGGYSSLEPQRQAEYAAVVANTAGILLDLWGVRWVAAPNRWPNPPVYKATVFYPGRPLFDAGRGNLASEERFRVPDWPTTDIRLIAALAYADGLPEGAQVGEIVVVTTDGRRWTLPLLVGEHVSEWAYDRPDVRARVRHRRAEVAYSWTVTDPGFDPYQMHYFYSQHTLPERGAIQEVVLRYTHPQGVLRVFGLALNDAVTDQAHQVGQLDRAKYRLVYTDHDVRLYENTAVFPRAFITTVGVLPRPDLPALYSMYLDPFDPRSEVLLDTRPTTGTAPLRRMGEGAPPPPAPPRPATIVSYTPERVVVRAEADAPGFLVLTDLYYPGWRVWVDGVEAELLRGDYLFRAVPIGPGSHEVEFVFEPLTVRVGGLVSALTLALLASALLIVWRWPRRTA